MMLAFVAILLLAKAQANDRAEAVEVPSQPSGDDASSLGLQRNFGVQQKVDAIGLDEGSLFGLQRSFVVRNGAASVAEAGSGVIDNLRDASVLGLQRGWTVKKGVVVTEEAAVAGEAPLIPSVLGLQRGFSVKKGAGVAEASGVSENLSDASVLGLQRGWSVKKGVVDDKEVADVGKAVPDASILGFQSGFAIQKGAGVAEEYPPSVDATGGSEFLQRGFSAVKEALPTQGEMLPAANILGLQLSVSMRKTQSAVETDFV